MNTKITYLSRLAVLTFIACIWVNSGNLFAQNQSSSSQSSRSAITTFPFTETFETNSVTLEDWTQHATGGNEVWTFTTGAEGGSITTAYEGSRNAKFISKDGPGLQTMLLTPVLNLSTLSSPKLSFYLGQEAWEQDQNITVVEYRTSPTAAWVQLAWISDNLNEWTHFELTLPNPTATYQIAFIGINHWGRANVIDLVTVFESAPPAVVNSFPFIESFEDNSTTLKDWRQVHEAGSAHWTFAEGGSGYHPYAYEGTRNAIFNGFQGWSFRTKLITPLLDLSDIASPKLSFYLGQPVMGPDTKMTKVFYRTSATAPWVLLASYDNHLVDWTYFQLSLPNPTSTYQIAFEAMNSYSSAIVLDLVKVFEGATPVVVNSFPFTETFETSSGTLSDWRQINETGTAIWTYAEGAGNGGIRSAFEGSRNARFISNANLGHKTKLVTPPLDLSGISSPKLSFYIGQQDWQGDQNTTKVFYRTSATASWFQLAHYTGDIGSWTQFELTLPNKSATYQIAFEGTNNYGFANVIDLVKVYDISTSIHNPEAAETIQVYAHGDVIHLVTDSPEPAVVNVYNLTGQLILQGKTSGNTHSTLNASKLKNGIYVVNVVQNNGVVVSRKVSIQK